MDVTPLIKSGNLVIESYGEEGITINGEAYTPPICVEPDKITKLSDIKSLRDITTDIIQGISNGQAGIIIIATMQEVSHTDIMRLKQCHGGIEVMDYGSACRQYNVLLAEGRQILAIFI